MNFWSEIVGQPQAVEVLERAAAPGGTPAHAWLITGPPGSGRSNLAYRFAAALIARSEADRDRVYAQVRAATHPDFAQLTTQAAVITIGAGRDIVTTAHYSPSEGRYRVIVVEDADRMAERTSNVLLKAIEEPPERTIWVLCAPSEADLLPTIRSRARSLRLVTPSAADVARLLVERDGIDPALAERAARLAQSHIGMAKRLASDPEAMDRRSNTINGALGARTLGDAMAVAASLISIAQADADALTEQLDSSEREAAMRNLGIAPGAAIPPKLRSQMKALEEDQGRRRKRSLRDGVDRILTDLLSLYRDVLLTSLGAIGEGGGSAGGGSTANLINEEAGEAIRELGDRWSPEQALAVVSAVEEARVRLASQITPGLVLEALFARIVMADSGVLES
ncbi:DNA polymerase III subunit delta' [Leucobacter denitrificans]|uniref:DNA polymerase III subunit delta n=1 Tax=Leucobacter denitrificans TaxID=683042 RepID=A0A7G9S3A0_9MICO|nr:DNA polymerase III subunit delta' [Leucobacter denitrificans]QNN62325.1 DNA polymerase III subunit delta' [Leucobacter denitrificans]